MCDRSRGRSGCTRHRMTVRANGSFHVWISGASGCRLPRDVATARITNTIATRRFPGSTCLPRTCQVIGPRLAVAILHIPARATTRRSTPHPPHRTHTHQPGDRTHREAGLALRATVAILHRTTSPATWRGTTPTPTHDCHKGTSRAVPHPLAGSSRQGIHHHA